MTANAYLAMHDGKSTKSWMFGVNQETVNDTAKLTMHRLIGEFGGDPSLLDRARISPANMAERFADRPFVREWYD
jgi:hypothetical protein